MVMNASWMWTFGETDFNNSNNKFSVRQYTKYSIRKYLFYSKLYSKIPSYYRFIKPFLFPTAYQLTYYILYIYTIIITYTIVDLLHASTVYYCKYYSLTSILWNDPQVVTIVYHGIITAKV